MCDASGNKDDIYIDNIQISGSTVVNPDSYLVTKGPILAELISEDDLAEEISIYPNPVYNSVNINLPDNTNAEVHIYNMSGELLYEGKLKNNHETIDLSKFDKGMYIIHIMNAEESYTKKIIKQ